MRVIIIRLLLLLLFASPVMATTYYVRSDGGTYTQCTGLVDAAYPGAGLAQACGWKHPFEALGVEASTTNLQHIVGGDTVIIKNGSYKMGYDSTDYNTSKCSSSYPYDCYAKSPPAGTAEAPTRILGEGYNTGCPTPPELWGTEKTKMVVQLYNTAHIDMQCLEITDHEACTVNTNLPVGIQCATTYPYGDYAQVGIKLRTVDTLNLKNVNIHGITGPGVLGAEITDLTLEDVKISYNNKGGWNGETPAATPNEFYGHINLTRVDVSWNGCIEAYPTDGQLVDDGCVGGNLGGFGDGVGLQATGGTWVIDDATFIGNVEDGLDMLYMRTKKGNVIVKNSYFAHNAGNSVKTGGDAVIVNNEIIGDCDYFTGKPFVQDATNNGAVVACRGNAAVSITLQKQDHSATIINNSMSGQADAIIVAGSSAAGATTCDGSERLYIGGNIFYGGTQYQRVTPTPKVVDAYYIWNTCDGFESTQYKNVIFNTKNEATNCVDDPSSLCGVDPKITSFNESTNTYSMILLPDSPAIDRGLIIGAEYGYNASIIVAPAEDRIGANRSTSDAGSYEYGGAIVVPVCDALTHQDLCTPTTTPTCVDVGWYWWTNNTCNTDQQPSVVPPTGSKKRFRFAGVSLQAGDKELTID